jgi:hypothetical protein
MIVRALFVMLPLVLFAACGDNRVAAGDVPPPQTDAGPPDAGMPDAACFLNPQTYNEIINACTTAVKVFKDSHPALLNPDGTVPPLPGT